MLAAMEDLLDSWPGTLFVFIHDRYLMERITDQQHAVLEGSLRHLPDGVDEYVRLSRERRTTSEGVGRSGTRRAPLTCPRNRGRPMLGPAASATAPGHRAARRPR